MPELKRVYLEIHCLFHEQKKIKLHLCWNVGAGGLRWLVPPPGFTPAAAAAHITDDVMKLPPPQPLLPPQAADAFLGFRTIRPSTTGATV